MRAAAFGRLSVEGRAGWTQTEPLAIVLDASSWAPSLLALLLFLGVRQ